LPKIKIDQHLVKLTGQQCLVFISLSKCQCVHSIVSTADNNQPKH